MAPDSLEAALLQVQTLARQIQSEAARQAAEEVVRQHPESAKARRLFEELR